MQLDFLSLLLLLCIFCFSLLPFIFRLALFTITFININIYLFLMAIVVVLVGQCGNQLGDELFTQLALSTGITAAPISTTNNSKGAFSTTTASASPAFSPFFTRDGMARCVLVDTEPKVVLGVRQRHADFMRADNVVHGQSGRGNNWGLGYHGVKTALSKRNERNAAVQRAFRNFARDQREEDDNVLGRALQAIYRETRRTSDAEDGSGGFEAILLIHSLVGGTGSGLASRLTERLRLYFTEPPPGQSVDEVLESAMMRVDGLDGGLYGAQRRARHLVNIAVAPQVVGEVATQGLNAALTLQVLQKHADAVILLRNDDALAPGEATGGSSSPGTSILSRCVTFKEVNEVLVALLLPVLHYGVEPGCVTQLLMQCIPPAYVHTTGGNKILTLMPTPQRSYAVLRRCVHRALFCAITGGRAFMPGYAPTVPIEELLSETAQQLWRSQPRRTSKKESGFSISDTRTTKTTAALKAKPKQSASATRRGQKPQKRCQQESRQQPLSAGLSTQRVQLDDGNDDHQRREQSMRRGSSSGLREDSMRGVQQRLSGRPRQRLGFRTDDDSGMARPARSSVEGTFAVSPFAASAASASSLTSPAGAASPRRRAPVTPFSSPPQPTRSRARVQAAVSRPLDDYPDDVQQQQHQQQQQRVSYDNHTVKDFAEAATTAGEQAERAWQHQRGDDADEAMTQLNHQVFRQCSTKIPAALYSHYLQLRRAPVAKMFATIDGVLLMNEALELDRKVLFPLLRSAALKVSTGAFMSSYEDVGVTSERVTRAIREVAEVMTNSEEL